MAMPMPSLSSTIVDDHVARPHSMGTGGALSLSHSRLTGSQNPGLSLTSVTLQLPPVVANTAATTSTTPTSVAAATGSILQMHSFNHSVDQYDQLSPGWERRIDPLGQTYHVDHKTRSMTWNRPSANQLVNSTTQEGELNAARNPGVSSPMTCWKRTIQTITMQPQSATVSMPFQPLSPP